jgi:hypothetical protein
MDFVKYFREGYNIQLSGLDIETSFRKDKIPSNKIFELDNYVSLLTKLYNKPGRFAKQMGSYACSAVHPIESFLNLRYLNILSD